MTEHIDGNQINSNLRSRFDYLSKFLNFTSDDIAMLNKFAGIILQRVPVVVDAVYRKLLAFDITKQYFLIRNDGFEGHLTKKSSNLTVDSAQMKFRKDMLSIYLKRILTQTEWDDTFLQYLSRIGKMHTDKAGSSSINIDYIHISGLFGFLEHLLIDALWTAENIDSKTKYAMFAALNKLFWIQNDFFSMHYLSSWDDSAATNEAEIKKPKHCCF
ncbi:unnamed protein product [Rotaria socialis]|uniref:Globin-sensor domain-containing protein n=1 Tax=Rotaria socialis TaxID=392032 RepID=A0A820BAR4_9BILA|nr:unnamed protein product [Rotaria socialis]CAF3483259.1 unnamed protein product [Rotaria socialis]CAF3535448.1 unnamed protein product [Rotaria socialis]CAF3560625.1 unnamed protein product [Rotaria socialis]CAF3726542.1 unnamed protein product [Rotaria socialis]